MHYPRPSTLALRLLLSVAVSQVFGPAAQGITLTASATVALPLDGPGSPQSDFDFQSGESALIAQASASDAVDYNAATPTLFSRSAFAEATLDSLRTTTQFSAQSLVPEVRNEGASSQRLRRSAGSTPPPTTRRRPISGSARSSRSTGRFRPIPS
jgi:hypothetical protein